MIYGKYLEHKIKEQYNKCWHPVIGKKSNPLLAFILIIMPFNIGSIALIVYVSYKISLIIDDGSIHIRPEYFLFIAMINIMVIVIIIKLRNMVKTEKESYKKTFNIQLIDLRNIIEKALNGQGYEFSKQKLIQIGRSLRISMM